MNQAPPFRTAVAASPIHEQLGPLVASYGRAKGAAARFVIGALLFLGATGYWVDMLLTATEDRSVGAAELAGDSLLGLLFLSVAVVCVAQLWRTRAMRLDVHARGLALLQRGRSVEMLWEEIVRWKAHVVTTRVNGVPAGTRHHYTFETADGRRVVLTEVLQNIGELHARVESEVVRRRVPAILASFEAGEPQVFGPVVATRQGLSFKKRELPWSELGGAAVANGFITVSGKRRRWARVAYRHVWNAQALLLLCSRQLDAPP